MEIYYYYIAFLACVLVQDSFQKSVTPATPYPLGDVRNCRVHCSLHILDHDTECNSLPADVIGMEVMPGGGFDNLRNIDMGLVHFHNYSSCKLSNDGKYLLPDNMFLIPRHGSTVETFAEFMDHWDLHTSLTASSINKVSVGFFSGGLYSQDYMSVKSHMVNDLTMAARVQVRHLLYTVQLGQDRQLHPSFKSRLFEIAAHLQNNNTDLVHYLAELIVHDFGTHFVTSMEAGAVMSKTDHISANYSSINTVSASASIDFQEKFLSGSLYASLAGQAKVDDYTSNVKYSTFSTLGGPPFENYTDWQRGIADALVAIDRDGAPLHFAITPTTLPELPETTVQELADIIYSAISRYYKVNTREGCTNPNDPNFNFQANLDDGSCKPPITNLSFGGIFQKCFTDPTFNTENLCTGGPNPAQQVNPLTDDFTCPDKYVPIQLHSGTVTHVTKKNVCHDVCKHCGTWGTHRCCKCQNVLTDFLSKATYEAYWCAALPGTTIPDNSGYLFGGVYTAATSNPFTGAKSCPRYFIPLHMGEDIQVCVSTDYEQGTMYSLPFAGFDSCLVGNPLAADPKNKKNMTSNSVANWPKTCPHGYAQHLVAVDEGCEINFCIHTGFFKANKTLLPARLPPFRKHPKHKSNITETLVVSGLYGDTWIKREDGTWQKEASGAQTGDDLLRALGESSSNSNSTQPAAESSSSEVFITVVSVIGSLFIGVIVIVFVFAVYKQCWTPRKKRRACAGEYASLINRDDVNPIN